MACNDCNTTNKCPDTIECGCNIELDTLCVRYTGSTLNNIGVNSGDRLEDILASIDTYLSEFYNSILGSSIPFLQLDGTVNPNADTVKDNLNFDENPFEKPNWTDLSVAPKGYVDIFHRDNYDIIKDASDFPTAVGGVITLQNDIEIEGTYVLSDQIDLNGYAIIGVNPWRDILVYTGNSHFITNTNNTQPSGITNVSVSSGATGTEVFNITKPSMVLGSGGILVTRCAIFNSAKIGTFTNLPSVTFTDVIVGSTADGLTLDNCWAVEVENVKMTESAAGYFLDFTGSGVFNRVRVFGGRISNNNGIRVAGTATVSGAVVNSQMEVPYSLGTSSSSWLIYGQESLSGDNERFSEILYEKGIRFHDNDIEITDFSKGIILTSPDSTRYRITMLNGGVLDINAV